MVANCEHTTGALGVRRVRRVKLYGQIVIIDFKEVAFTSDFEEREVVLVVRIVVRAEFLIGANRAENSGPEAMIQFCY